MEFTEPPNTSLQTPSNPENPVHTSKAKPNILLINDPDFEAYITPSTKTLDRELQYVFPSLDVKTGITVIATLQKSKVDLVSYGPEEEREKDRLLINFMKLGESLSLSLSTVGYWIDYIDPCSGLPMLAQSSGKTFNEVDCVTSLLQFRSMNAGCCKILLHPGWGSAVYPASIFTTAPHDVIISHIQRYCNSIIES
mmetsp:Transcript_35016/g.35654  ORF Transcript_35016/g.35654 Transcript_35016/m.35654 type:complete len:196 (+) Transcript_35016:130-717(+)